jgi:hypothetical protein
MAAIRVISRRGYSLGRKKTKSFEKRSHGVKIGRCEPKVFEILSCEFFRRLPIRDSLKDLWLLAVDLHVAVRQGHGCGSLRLLANRSPKVAG